MAKARLLESQLDAVRRTIIDRIGAMPNANLKAASLALGRNETYLHQYLHYGSPVKLDEDDRLKLADYLGLPERDLRPTTAFFERPNDFNAPPAATQAPVPMAPYENRDLMGDLVAALDRLHREERLPLELRELGIAAWDMHADITSAGDNLRQGLESALAARRRWLRKERAAILSSQARQ